jgi:hypothetical protein
MAVKELSMQSHPKVKMISFGNILFWISMQEWCHLSAISKEIAVLQLLVHSPQEVATYSLKHFWASTR